MQHQANSARSLLALIGLAIGLSGCAGGTPHSGRRILDDLERAHVPAPDDTGMSRGPESEADLPNSGPIELADLLRVAEARNPTLGAARSAVGIAAGARWQASLYPNPRTDLLVEDVSWKNGFSDSKTTVGVTQPIILGDRRRAAMDAASAEQAARMADVEAQRREVFGDISAGHIRLVSIREQLRLYVELRALADRTLSAAKTRLEARAAPETDVIRPRVEVYRLDAALARLGQEQVASARRLGFLVGGLDIDPLRIEGGIPTDPLDLDASALQARARATHPALVVADREIDAAAASLERVRAERTPDLDVRVAAGYRNERDDGIVEFGAGMIVPLWDNRQGDLMSARFQLMRARQNRAAIENDLLGRLAAAIGEYNAARAQLTTLRDQIVPDALRAFEQTGEAYRGGRSTFLDLLDAQRTLTEARVTLAELASAAATARVTIVQIVGPDDPVSPDRSPRAVPDSTVSSTPEERPAGAEVKP